MSLRNLKPSALSYLASASSVKIAHLIRFDIPTTDAEGVPTVTPAYLTDYGSNITWNSKTYQAGKITKVGSVKQGQGLINYKMSIDVAGEYQEELDRGLIENLQYSYVGNEIEVLRAYLDDTGAIIAFDQDTDGPMQYFIGDITNIDISEGIVSGNSKVSWKCAGKFQDFELINGRMTDDSSHRGIVTNSSTGLAEPSVGAKTEAHQNDTGFQHANQTIEVVSSYLTTVNKYKMKSRYPWQSDKLVSYEEEVERELELGVSLAAKFLPKIYGVQKVSGIPVFIDALKTDATQVYIVYAFAEGEIDGFLNFHIDGQSILCTSQKDVEARVCVGSTANGDTLSAYSSTSSNYNQVIGEAPRKYRFDSEWESGGYIDPIPPVVDKDSTIGTAQNDFFTITTDTGTKEIEVFHGTSNQAAASSLVSIAQDPNGGFLRQDAWYAKEHEKDSSVQRNDYWNAQSQLLDTAYVVVKIQISEEETEMPELEAVISGSLVSTFDAAGTESELQYTLDPVWQLRDYMVDNICGGNLPEELVDIDSFYKVSLKHSVQTTSYEDTFLTYWRYNGWKTAPIAGQDSGQRDVMQCNFAIKTENVVTKNISSMLAQFDGTLNIVGGKYRLTVEDNSAPIANIHVSEIKGSIKTKDLSNKNKWNSVQASIVDPGQGWATNSVNFFNSDFLAQDNGIKKKGNIQFNGITNYYTAREWAQRQLNKSRYSRELQFTTYFKYLYLQPNDNVTLTYDRFGYDNKTFRVKATTLKTDGLVDVTLEDFDSSIYSVQDSPDLGGEVTPSSPPALPPQNLEFITLPDARFSIATTEDVHGILVWDTAPVSEILRYNIRDWQEVSADYTVPTSQVISDSGVNKHYIVITDLNAVKDYTFKVLTVAKTGKLSKYAVLTFSNSKVTPISFNPVTNFRSIDTIAGEFTGTDLVVAWDENSNTVSSRYELSISDSSNSLLRTEYISKGNENPYTYTLAKNMIDYAAANGGNIGAIRDLQIKIRVTNGFLEGDASFVSSEWTNLI
jgi:hypothetical protein|tara:strand:+ start:3512 stop:6553 length:3042 start_codon:yes stop_codon:yes gene_type:complete